MTIKNINIIVGILIFCLMTSCNPADSVKFQNPQPSFEKAEANFGKRITGNYINGSNPDEFIVIGDSMIILKGYLLGYCSRNELQLDTAIDPKNDSALIDYFKSIGGSIILNNDSATYKVPYSDTIFKIGPNEILKKFRGDYFLNFRLDDNCWDLKMIYKKHDTLYLDDLVPKSILDNYNYVSKTETTEGDSLKVVQYVLNPDKSEFKKLLESGMFVHSEKYVEFKSLKSTK